MDGELTVIEGRVQTADGRWSASAVSRVMKDSTPLGVRGKTVARDDTGGASGTWDRPGNPTSELSTLSETAA